MILSTREKLQRRVSKLEKNVHNRNPNSYALLKIVGRDCKTIIAELKILIK